MLNLFHVVPIRKSMISLQTLLENNPQLPSPPIVAVRILDAVKKDDFDMQELARIIKTDPALSAKILRVANSSFYSLPDGVKSIDRALMVLGSVTLKNLALSFVIAKELRVESQAGLNVDKFWRRSITAAVSAELLSKLLGVRNDNAFVTALLQDVGVVIMYLLRPDDYLKALDEKRAASITVDEAERRIFGFTHQEVSCELLRIWGLPEEIFQPIFSHHLPEKATPARRREAEILWLADTIAEIYHGVHSAGMIKEVKAFLASRHKIGEEKVDLLVDEVANNSLEVFTSFELDRGNLKPYSQILQEANEELARLNLSYEQLVMEYKQAKEEAERLAQELKDANDRLRDLASRDGLTGLFNHRYFQQLLDGELERAAQQNSHLSLIMFDIDHFKKINDTYGHPRGDKVLKSIGSLVDKLIDPGIIAARYGGEEFALILPGTDLRKASILAERLRLAVEKQVVSVDNFNIRATISVGVAAHMPNSSTGKSQLIEKADQALYASKHGGRNRVSVAR